MIDGVEAFRDREDRTEALLRRSREARARAIALRHEVKATRLAVTDLIGQARAISATLSVGEPSSLASGTSRMRLDPNAAASIEGVQPVPRESLSAEHPLGAVEHGWREGDLDELAQDMLAAYADARAWNDEETCALLRELLKRIGRHLAQCLGPRAAGVALN